jgi:hypothetical protein
MTGFSTTLTTAMRTQRSSRACIERRFGRALALATLAGALLPGGCPLGPDYTGAPDLKLPGQWSRKANPKPDHGKLDRWWERLRDPLRKPSEFIINYREAAKLFRPWVARDYVALAKALGGSIDPGDVSMQLVINVDTGPHLREFSQ